ncbi:MAG: Omp28-related outer membrane protein [Bacteroidales bacterium]|nr:Omp28-related outer membrane protein [Bacteroidales bacterium]
MKKILLLVLSFIAMVIPSMADTMEFGYCGPIGGTFGSGNAVGTTYGEALEIPAATAASYDGCKITGVSVGFGTAEKCEVEVFLSTNLKKDPFYTQKATVKPNQFTVVELDEPYEITGKRVYVGYKFVSSSTSDSPMAFDYDEALRSTYGNWVSISVTGSDFNSRWEHYYASYGNVCVRAILEGNVSGKATVTPVAVDVSPLVRPGKEFTATLTLLNTSAQPAESIEVEWKAGEETGTMEYVFDTPLEPSRRHTATIRLMATEENENLPLQFRVTKVNGERNYEDDVTLRSTVCCSNIYSVRNLLVEKNTGVQCGWCPRGIYAFERMEEEVTDGSFIPVAVHNYSRDPMACDSYKPWNDKFVGYGAPKATFNRVSTSNTDPSYENVRSMYESMRTVTYADISLQTNVSGAYADVVATALFSKDLSGINYGMGFILVENNVGPYSQANNYAGGSTSMGGFESMPSAVPLIYNDVARQIFDWNGDSGTIPSSVTAGTSYTTTRSLSLSGCKDVINVKVIAFIVNKNSGEIVNATRVSLGKSTGVESIEEAARNVSVSCTGNQISASGDFNLARVYSIGGTVVDTLRPGESATVSSGLYLIKIEGGSDNGKIFKVISR